jgi:hypothetical protein
MLLVPVVDIREALGFEDMTDINAAAETALNAATSLLESMLDTDFSKATRTDRFYAHEPGVVRGPSVQTQFRLRRGFVQSVSSVIYADALSNLGLGATSLDLADLYLDAEKGVLRDDVTAYSRSYLKVTYTAGFDPHPSDPSQYDPDQIPDWLQQAAKLRAQISLAGQPVMESANIKLDVKELTNELNALVGRKRRYAPLALLPL